METLLKDARYGFRMLVRSPGFTVVALLSLALGIGANTAIFSMISAFLFAPLPVEQTSRLVSIFTTDVKNPGPLPTSHLNYIDYRDKNEAFTDIVAYTFAGLSYSSPGGESKNLFAQVVSGNYFGVLGVKAQHGRTFLPDEDRTPGTHPAVVLSHSGWQRDFGGDPAIIGKTISLNRNDFTVVGVAQKDFTGTDIGGGPDPWVPMMMHAVVQPGFDWYDTRRGLFLARDRDTNGFGRRARERYGAGANAGRHSAFGGGGVGARRRLLDYTLRVESAVLDQRNRPDNIWRDLGIVDRRRAGRELRSRPPGDEGRSDHSAQIRVSSVGEELKIAKCKLQIETL